MGKQSKGKAKKQRRPLSAPGGTGVPGGRPTEAAAFLPYHFPVFLRLIDEVGGTRELVHKSAKPTQQLLQRSLGILSPPCQLTNLQSTGVIASLLRIVRNRMQEVLVAHSVYFWLHLIRRIPPDDLLDDNSPVTLHLYRGILEAALLKFGAASSEASFGFRPLRPEEYARPGTAERQPAEYIPQDVRLTGLLGEDLVQAYSAIHLAHEYWRLTAAYRRVQKGGTLLVDAAYHYRVLNDDETETLIRSYDQRGERLSDNATLDGVPMEVGKIARGETGCLIPMYNAARTVIPEDHFLALWGVRPTKVFDAAPAFMWIPIDFQRYAERHSYLRDQFHSTFGFSLETWLDFLRGLALRVLLVARRRGEPGAYQFGEFAYDVLPSAEWLLEEIDAYFSSPGWRAFDSPWTRPELEEIMRRFTLTDSFRDEIDLTTMGPRPLLVNVEGGHLLVDFSAIPWLLQTVPHMLRAPAQQRKGAGFEEFVADQMRRADITVWGRQRVLKANDGTEREIDVALAVDDALIVCEARCIGMSLGFHRGDRLALRFRQKKMAQALIDADDKAAWLVDHPIGANYSIQEGTSKVMPLVLSPFVEYIWSRDVNLWVTPDVPRICTPEELVSLIRSGGWKAARQAPWALRFSQI